MDCPNCHMPLEHHSFANARACWGELEAKIADHRADLAVKESGQRALQRRILAAKASFT